MGTKIETLRSFGQWVEVKNLGPEPYELRGTDSHTGARVRYVIGQDEDGAGAVLTTISPAKDDLGKKLSEGYRAAGI